jgi:hypothetical protein
MKRIIVIPIVTTENPKMVVGPCSYMMDLKLTQMALLDNLDTLVMFAWVV